MTENQGKAEDQQANGQHHVDEAQRQVVADALREMGKVAFINLSQPAARALVVLEIEVADGRVKMSNVLVKNRIYTGE